MILSDLHIHSTFSDGKLSIPELVDLYGKRGFGAIAITDHLCEQETVIGKAAAYLGQTLTRATFPIYSEILKSEAERAWRRYKMVVIPGFEITRNSLSNHRSAHILALGVTEYISASGGIVELTQKIRNCGGISVAAHPVFTRKVEKQTFHLWDHKEELRPYFDAWEVASGRHLFHEVIQAKLPMVANSDLHRPHQINSWKTLLNCHKHPEAVLEAIRLQKVEFKFYDEGIPHDFRGWVYNMAERS